MEKKGIKTWLALALCAVCVPYPRAARGMGWESNEMETILHAMSRYRPCVTCFSCARPCFNKSISGVPEDVLSHDRLCLCLSKGANRRETLRGDNKKDEKKKKIKSNLVRIMMEAQKPVRLVLSVIPGGIEMASNGFFVPSCTVVFLFLLYHSVGGIFFKAYSSSL